MLTWTAFSPIGGVGEVTKVSEQNGAAREPRGTQVVAKGFVLGKKQFCALTAAAPPRTSGYYST